MSTISPLPDVSNGSRTADSVLTERKEKSCLRLVCTGFSFGSNFGETNQERFLKNVGFGPTLRGLGNRCPGSGKFLIRRKF